MAGEGIISKIGEGISNFASMVSKSPVFKAAKFLASATIGIPIGVCLTTMMMTSYVALEAMAYFNKKVIQPNVHQTLTIPDQYWKDMADWVKKWHDKYWTEFGLGAFLDTAEFIKENMEEQQAESGWGRTVKLPDTVIPTTVEEAQKEIDKILKKTTSALSDDVNITPLHWGSVEDKNRDPKPSIPSPTINQFVRNPLEWREQSRDRYRLMDLESGLSHMEREAMEGNDLSAPDDKGVTPAAGENKGKPIVPISARANGGKMHGKGVTNNSQNYL